MSKIRDQSLSTFQRYWEREGYRISGKAYSGVRVLRDLEKSPHPDIILMDIALAGAIDGIEKARQIRQKRISRLSSSPRTRSATGSMRQRLSLHTGTSQNR